jgi:hypothetical protein
LIRVENSDMKPRHFLARIAAVVTAAAAIAMLLGPARADASDHDDPDGRANQDSRSAMAQDSGTLLEGWANRGLDIGDFATAMAEELGSRLDGWETADMDLNPTELWAAMAFGIGSILDGWGNRDMDIGAFAAGTWEGANTPNGGEELGSDW